MKNFFTILAVLFVFTAKGQQNGQYSLYMLNKYQFNSAYAGLDNSVSLTGVFRRQWLGLEGSPSMQNLNVHMPLYYLHGGIGLNIDNMNIGAQQNISATLSYSYHHPVGEVGILSIGAGGGIFQKTIDGSKLRTPDGEYQENIPVINHNDPFLSEISQSAMTPVFNAGIYFQSEKLEVGISAINLIEPNVSIALDNNVNIQLNRHYFATMAYNWEIGNFLELRPSVMVKSDLQETQMEISTIVEYNDNIFGGVAFRGYNKNTIDAATFLAGTKLSEKITLAYSYDLTLSSYNSVSRGSHEILINYNLNKKIGAGIPPRIIHNPRFL